MSPLPGDPAPITPVNPPASALADARLGRPRSVSRGRRIHPFGGGLSHRRSAESVTSRPWTLEVLESKSVSEDASESVLSQSRNAAGPVQLVTGGGSRG